MASQPGQDWSGSELASRLGIKPPNLLTQLAERTRLGFLSKTGRGRYALLVRPDRRHRQRRTVTQKLPRRY